MLSDFPMNETSTFDDNISLKLTEWELANLHLPPVTTVTLYEGSAPLAFLRKRLAVIFKKNPWLASRIVKKTTANGVVALAYSTKLDVESAIEQHFTVYKPGEVGLSPGMSYDEIVRCLLPVQCARSKPATDCDEPLFKVAVVPLEAESKGNVQPMPLQKTITLPGFGLVVSINHTLGDGHTYYKLYNMLGMDSEVETLDPVRVEGFEKAKTDIIGEKETAMLSSTGLAFGIMGTYFGAKLGRRGPQNVCINEVNPSWLAKEKKQAKEENKVPFVSSNDVLTSWFFREMEADTNIMLVNLRNRQPTVLNLNDSHVGNYEANLPYFPGDVEDPALIRQSIRETDGTFRARRAGSPETGIPGTWTLLKNSTSIITNWATFYRDVNLVNDAQDDKGSTLKPKLHFPIMESDGIITSVWNNAVVFRPSAGELAVLLITRHFSNEMLSQEKEKATPLGKRIL
jgi:hypothetical protein